MSDATAIKWRFLVVEDKPDIVRQLLEIAPLCVDAPDTVEVEVCSNFDQATPRLSGERFDVLILDLKDDSDESSDADDDPAGLKVFQRLKESRFVPVVFYTALAPKVRPEETSFVRVVEKTEDVTKVRDEVRNVLATRLPNVTRRLEELQRSYMWDFVSTNWKGFQTKHAHEKADLAYLLMRRLALNLQREASVMARQLAGEQADGEIISENIHPMEMYVRPPVHSDPLAGDILLEKTDEGEVYWLLLTPSCDFAQKKAEHIVMARCEALNSQKEYLDWVADHSKGSSLDSLIGDNRQGKRTVGIGDETFSCKLQPERFKFLPGTFFIPDLIADFQQIRSMPLHGLQKFELIASLDSPFAETVLARFARFFGRLGTLDIDKSAVLGRLKALLPASVDATPLADAVQKLAIPSSPTGDT